MIRLPAILLCALIAVSARKAEAAVIATVLPERANLYWMFEPLANEYYYPVDLNSDALVDFTIGYSFQGIFLRTERENRLIFAPDPPPNLGGPVKPLDAGFLIDSTVPGVGYAWRSSDLLGGFVDPGEFSFVTMIQCLSNGCTQNEYNGRRGYVGLEMRVAGEVHYGWLDVEVFRNSPTAAVYGWAWESAPNTPIIAGSVPEPGRGLMLLAGLNALVMRGRRRRGP